MKQWTTIILGFALGATGCDLEPPDGAGQGLSASGAGSSSGADAGDGTTGGVDETSIGSSSSTTAGPEPQPQPQPEPGGSTGSTSSAGESGSSSGGWWGGSSSGDWGSSSGGFADLCVGHLDAASCEDEAGCVWLAAGEDGVCLEDFGGVPGDVCSFLDAEFCDVLDQCGWDEEAGVCGPA